MTESTVRIGIFMGILVIMVLWEMLAPRRDVLLRPLRWSNNFGMLLLDTLLVRMLFPVLAVGVAVTAQEYNWGLFNNVKAPNWLAFIVSLLILDFAIYVQHRVFHAIPILWRLHRVHHADTGFDVTTGLRFHPLEIAVSLGYKFLVIVLLGPSALVVLVFEVVLNATSMFNHGNVRLPAGWDRILRCLIVTPDMHRVHHSIYQNETDSNFGFNVPWWDKLFGSYRSQPHDGHATMSIGLNQFRTPREHCLDRLLLQPMRATAAAPEAITTVDRARPTKNN